MYNTPDMLIANRNKIYRISCDSNGGGGEQKRKSWFIIKNVLFKKISNPILQEYRFTK